MSRQDKAKDTVHSSFNYTTETHEIPKKYQLF